MGLVFKVRGFIQKFIATLCMLTTFFVHAEGCQKVIISAYQNWPPYSSVDQQELKGVGLEVASQLFQTLDIPVEIAMIDKPSHMALLLKQGKIDVLAATYRVPELEEAVVFAEPAYFDDALAIVVASDRKITFNRWYDLMGYRGVMVNQTQVGAEFARFAEANLTFEYVSSLDAAFDKVKSHDVDYVVGSLELLRHYLIQVGQLEDFQFLDNLVQPEPVYLAFSKASPCQAYLPYIQDRLKIMRSSGQIEGLLQKFSVE